MCVCCKPTTVVEKFKQSPAGINSTGCYIFWCDRIGVLIAVLGMMYEPVRPSQYVHCSRRLIRA